MNPPKQLFILMILLCLTVVGSGLAPHPLAAQNGNNAALRITHVNIDAFPDVALTVDGVNLDEALMDLPFTLTENGEERTIEGRGPAEVGTQTALLIDASGSLQDPGLTGKRRDEEMRNVVERMISQGTLSPDTDWLGAFAPGSTTGEIKTIELWTTDHQAVWNQLYLYQLPPIGQESPLFDLIFFGLDSFADSGLQPNLYRSIVLFSDGEVGGSATQLQDAIDRAVREQVVIHTIQLGDVSPEAAANMQRLAIVTGGHYTQIRQEGDADVIWNLLQEERTQLALTFRSRAAQPRELGVAATLSNGRVVRAAVAYPSLTVAPVSIVINSPANQAVIEKEAPEFDTPIAELEPKTLEIQAELDWVDERPRVLRQVEYFVGNSSRVVTEAPFDRISFPIETLDAGTYSMRAIATDELGVSSSSQPVEIVVQVHRPPPPPPTVPMVRIGNMLIPEDRMRTGASIGAVLLAILSLVIALRKPSVRKQVTEVLGNIVKEVTQPLGLNRSNGGFGQAKASLIVLEGDGKLHGTIDLRRANNKIGRSPDQANIVLNDPHVSRYHCRVTEESDGSFCIWDEGSTSGTFVNQEPVDLRSGRVLMPGDLITIGGCTFEFQYKSNDKDATQPFGHGNGSDSSHAKDVTEPAVQRRPY